MFIQMLLVSVSSTEGWESRWVNSEHKGSEQGVFKWSAGKFYGDPEKDKGEPSVNLITVMQIIKTIITVICLRLFLFLTLYCGMKDFFSNYLPCVKDILIIYGG